jgi:hypothetical protein
MKRPFKVWRPTRTGPLPERLTLERGAARELLTTWELTKNKELVDRHLATMDKVYGQGAEQRIRQHMRQIRRDERLA